MTLYIGRKVVCIACGATSSIESLSSTHTHGLPDLDTRPAHDYRRTIASWICRCSTCGYCAPDLSQGESGAREWVNRREYIAQCLDEGFPKRANWFLCWSLIAKWGGRFDRAAWACIHAAWVCDDADAREAAVICRTRAINFMSEADRTAQDVCATPEQRDLLCVDLLRRIARFHEAVARIDKAIAGMPSEIACWILAYQRALCDAKVDSGRSTLDAINATPEWSSQRERAKGTEARTRRDRLGAMSRVRARVAPAPKSLSAIRLMPVPRQTDAFSRDRGQPLAPEVLAEMMRNRPPDLSPVRLPDDGEVLRREFEESFERPIPEAWIDDFRMLSIDTERRMLVSETTGPELFLSSSDFDRVVHLAPLGYLAVGFRARFFLGQAFIYSRKTTRECVHLYVPLGGTNETLRAAASFVRSFIPEYMCLRDAVLSQGGRLLACECVGSNMYRADYEDGDVRIQYPQRFDGHDARDAFSALARRELDFDTWSDH